MTKYDILHKRGIILFCLCDLLIVTAQMITLMLILQCQVLYIMASSLLCHSITTSIGTHYVKSSLLLIRNKKCPEEVKISWETDCGILLKYLAGRQSHSVAKKLLSTKPLLKMHKKSPLDIELARTMVGFQQIYMVWWSSRDISLPIDRQSECQTERSYQEQAMTVSGGNIKPFHPYSPLFA